MKLVIFLLCICYALCNLDEVKIKLNLHEKECTTELYGEEIEVKYFNRRYLPEDNDMVTRIIECSWKKDGLISENGEILYDNLKKFIISKFRTAGDCSYYLALLISGDIYNHCKNITGKSTGEVAVKLSNCILKRIDSY